MPISLIRLLLDGYLFSFFCILTYSAIYSIVFCTLYDFAALDIFYVLFGRLKRFNGIDISQYILCVLLDNESYFLQLYFNCCSVTIHIWKRK